MALQLRFAQSASRSSSLPLGVDHYGGYIVVLESSRTSVTVRYALAFDPNEPHTFGRALERAGVSERRAIVAVPTGAARVSVFANGAAIPPAYRSLAARANGPEAIPSGKMDDLVSRLTILDDGTSTIVACAKNDVEETTDAVRRYEIEPIALDIPAAAWLRVSNIGIIDLRHDFVALQTPSGAYSATVGTAINDLDRAANISQVISNARTQRGYRGETIAITGLDGVDDGFLDTLRRRVGDTPEIVPLSIEGRVMPPWAFAYGLALWSLAS